MLLLFSTLAIAGYGDASDGFPSYGERALHHWTNAARVDPEAHAAQYTAGGCSIDAFSPDERVPKPALAYDYELNRAARAHTADMAQNDFFDHASSDGTEAVLRIEDYYGNPNVGENISQGYANHKEAVLRGWMCSTAGHRGNIMDGNFRDLGTGFVADLRTQDFGGRAGNPRPIAMGIHLPHAPTISVGYYADWYDAGGRAPDRFDVIVDGEAFAMELDLGAPGLGIYSYAGDLPSASCALYHFEAQLDGELHTWPEEGSYAWGDCDVADADAMWDDEQIGAAADDDEEEPILCACNTAAPAPWWVWCAVLLVVRRRRWK